MDRLTQQIETIIDFWDNIFHMEYPTITTIIVPELYANITHNVWDDHKEFFNLNSGKHDQVYIGSAEQMFLYLYFTNSYKFKEGKAYFATTKCNRPRDIDPPLHLPVFNKTEFFMPLSVNEPQEQYFRFAEDLATIAKDAFVNVGIDKKLLKIRKEGNDNQGLCVDFVQYDVIFNKGDEEIELGSYGFRFYQEEEKDKYLYWAYGTIVAHERFAEVLKIQGQMWLEKVLLDKTDALKYSEGYHTKDIESGKLGEVSKITEEYEEFIDAVNQGNKILSLIELSDLIGAIEFYVQSNTGLELSDVLEMKNATRRSFESGERNGK